MHNAWRNHTMTTTQNTTATMETARALAILATGDDQLDD
jgi:hypothetical protein